MWGKRELDWSKGSRKLFARLLCDFQEMFFRYVLMFVSWRILASIVVSWEFLDCEKMKYDSLNFNMMFCFSRLILLQNSGEVEDHEHRDPYWLCGRMQGGFCERICFVISARLSDDIDLALLNTVLGRMVDHSDWPETWYSDGLVRSWGVSWVVTYDGCLVLMGDVIGVDWHVLDLFYRSVEVGIVNSVFWVFRRGWCWISHTLGEGQRGRWRYLV
jgi:hypothetical protein